MTVWVILADSLPVWALGIYGNEWFATPHVDKLASRSVVFHQHFADTPRPLRPDAIIPFFPWTTSTGDLDLESIHWVEAPHLDWPTPKTELDEWIAAAENAAGLFDRWLGTWLQSTDIRRDWLIVTSGRGVPIVETEWWKPDIGPLHESLVHVPLIVHLPHDEQAGRGVFALSQTVDLAVTLAEFTGREIQPDWHGRSLLPLLRGVTTCRPYAILGSVESNTWALQSNVEKLLLDEAPGNNRQLRYFLKPDDRWEVNDLRHVHFERAEQIAGILEQVINSSRESKPINYPPLPRKENEDGHGQTRG